MPSGGASADAWLLTILQVTVFSAYCRWYSGSPISAFGRIVRLWNCTRWCCPRSMTLEMLSLNDWSVSAGSPTIMSTNVGIPSWTNRRWSSAYVSSEMFCRLIASSTSGVVVWIEMFISVARPPSEIAFIVK